MLLLPAQFRTRRIQVDGESIGTAPDSVPAIRDAARPTRAPSAST